MPEPFVHVGFPARVVLGAGTLARVPEEVDLPGIDRVLLLITGSAKADGDRLAQAAVKMATSWPVNPVPVDAEVLRGLLARAWAGTRPETGR